MKESRLHQVLTAIIDILWLGLLWLLCSLPLVTLGAASTALYYSMILLYCAIGIPMSTFLIRGLMDSIPMELEEAAYIDGCGFFGRFFHIILPLSRTGIVTAATFEFLTCWNEFVFANLIVSSHPLLHQPVLYGLCVHVRGHRHLHCALHYRLCPVPGADHRRHDQRCCQGINGSEKQEPCQTAGLSFVDFPGAKTYKKNSRNRGYYFRGGALYENRVPARGLAEGQLLCGLG